MINGGNVGHKFNVASAWKRTMDGIVFASQAEMKRYIELKHMECNKQIIRLELQPAFELYPSVTQWDTGEKHRPITYIADFAYTQDGQYIVEDVKGKATPEYKIKKKLFITYANKNHIVFKEIAVKRSWYYTTRKKTAPVKRKNPFTRR